MLRLLRAVPAHGGHNQAKCCNLPCPGLSWRTSSVWIGLAGVASAAGLQDGQAFRSVDRHGKVGASLSTQAVANVIKRRARLAGLDDAEFSGHSLRAGLITAAAMANVSERVIAKQSGHKSLPVLRPTYAKVRSLQRTRRQRWGCRPSEAPPLTAEISGSAGALVRVGASWPS
jgi:hypothetical protein